MHQKIARTEINGSCFIIEVEQRFAISRTTFIKEWVSSRRLVL